MHDWEVDIVTSLQAQLATLFKKIMDLASRDNVVPPTFSFSYEYYYMFRHTTFECGFVNNNVYGGSIFESCSYDGGPF